MKKAIAATVVGAVLLSAPVVFASDKTPSDASVKEPVKTETVAPVKKSPAAKVSTPAPASDAVVVKNTPAAQEKAVKEEAGKPAKAVAGQAGPEGDSVKAKAKSVKKSKTVKPLETTSLDVKKAASAKPITN